MVDFNLKLSESEQVRRNLQVSIKIQFNGCSIDPQELEDKINYLLASSTHKHLSGFIADLIRLSGAKTWEEGEISVRERK